MELLVETVGTARKTIRVAGDDYPAELVKAAALREKAAQAVQTGGGDYVITGEGDPEIDAKVLARYEAKKAKNFAEADRIRDELKAQGVEVTDVKGGASWKRV